MIAYVKFAEEHRRWWGQDVLPSTLSPREGTGREELRDKNQEMEHMGRSDILRVQFEEEDRRVNKYE